MNTESRRVCPSCGNEFSGAVEFCPVCMLRGALAGKAESNLSALGEVQVETTAEVLPGAAHVHNADAAG
jgi:predicted amidophosphoribosyltransferase